MPAPDQPRFSEPEPEAVFALFRQIGFEPPRDPADGDIAGWEFSGRAEVKFAVLRPGEPFGVSSPIPPASKSFLARLANHRNKAQVVTDPTGTYVFEPGKEMAHLPHPRKPWWRFWSR